MLCKTPVCLKINIFHNFHAEIKREYKRNSASFSKFFPPLSLLIEAFNILFCYFRSLLSTSIVEKNVRHNRWYSIYCLLVILAGKIVVVVVIVSVENRQCKNSTAKVVKKFANNSKWTVEIYSINFHQNQPLTQMYVSTHPEIVNRGQTYLSRLGFSVHVLWEHLLCLIIFWIWRATYRAIQ